MTHDREMPDPSDGADARHGDAHDDPAAEARLVALLHAARGHYNVPAAPPPFEAMWARVEAEHFGGAGEAAAPRAPAPLAIHARHGGAASRRWRRWGGPAVGLAAGLLLGVGVGAALWRGGGAARLAPATASAELPSSPGAHGATPSDPAYDAVATEYFDEAVALLAALPARLDGTSPDARLAAQARDLLSTTRLLLDSPTAGHDAELQALLDDLELVLAQVVRLPAVRDSSQAALIREALATRDVLPRLRTAAAQASDPHQSLGADE